MYIICIYVYIYIYTYTYEVPRGGLVVKSISAGPRVRSPRARIYIHISHDR